MLTDEARTLISDLLGLFSETSHLPIALYIFDEDGKEVERLSSSANFLPLHCRTIWEVGDGKGRLACQTDMLDRALATHKAGTSQAPSCYAGLTNPSDPVVLDGEVVAVIQYGAFVVKETESERPLRLAHEVAMRDLGASEAEALRIKNLLLTDTPRRQENEWEWVRGILPTVIGHVIQKYVIDANRVRKGQQLAFHELLTPLAAALATAENLYEDLPSPAVRERLHKLIGHIGSASTIVHNLTGGLFLPDQYVFRPHSIYQFVHSSLLLCRPEAQKKGLELLIDLHPNNGSTIIHASSRHLQVAFNNLLTNAVKYSYRTTSGSTKRHVTVRGRLQREGYQIAISNYGVGIEPDEIEAIFKDGYRGRQTSAEYRTGAGQGLWMTRRIIEGHGGVILVTSEPVGETVLSGPVPYHTRFTIWLPLKH